jgi:Cu(I)/Ag(I) efflux system membrane fusion protein
VPRPDRADDAGPGLVPIELSADRIQHMGLRTQPVAKRKLAATQRALATVAAAETGWSQATPRFAGWLERVYVTETGARVKRGQALATLYSPELVAAQEEYLATLGWASGPALPSLPGTKHDDAATPTLADDARRRLELFGMSKADIATITKSGKPMRAVTIRAATGGNVLSRSAVTGAYVQPGAVLFEIADLSTVWAWIEIPERDLGRIAVGQPATFAVTAYPGEEFSGKVGFLAPTVDATTRTLRARLELPNRAGRLRPGMSGQASIVLPEIDVVVVPDLALIDTGGARYVFVATSAGRFEPRRVEVGRRIDGWVELLPGRVAEGELVVTTGNFLLDAESRLQAQLQGGSGGTATGHEGH